jgi:hypothetical protein
MFDELEVVLAANVRPARPWEDDDRQLAEDGVDCRSAEPELAQVRPG